MENNADTFFNDIIKTELINFRGVAIGDTMDVVEALEGLDFRDTKGSLPNYKYFLEIGEMEELSIVYTYKEESNAIWQSQIRFSFYPKYYWEKAGGTDEMQFYEMLRNQQITSCIPEYVRLREKLSTHFNHILGPSEVDYKDFVFKRPEQNYKKETWLNNDMRLSMMSYIDDTKDPRGAITAEIVFILIGI